MRDATVIQWEKGKEQRDHCEILDPLRCRLWVRYGYMTNCITDAISPSERGACLWNPMSPGLNGPEIIGPLCPFMRVVVLAIKSIDGPSNESFSTPFASHSSNRVLPILVTRSHRRRLVWQAFIAAFRSFIERRMRSASGRVPPSPPQTEWDLPVLCFEVHQTVLLLNRVISSWFTSSRITTNRDLWIDEQWKVTSQANSLRSLVKLRRVVPAR